MPSMSETSRVYIDKLVHGGQGIGTLPDGKKVFVWNALPGEQVDIRLTKSRRGYAEGVAENVVTSSPSRVEPLDEAYLSTSPWQIMDFATENESKKAILVEAMDRELVKIVTPIVMNNGGNEWYYRNKMEYSFWADDDGIHPALFNRGTHNKQIVAGSSIARPEIDQVVQKVCSILTKTGVRGSQLKSIIIRCDQQGSCVLALYVKDELFPDIPDLKSLCKGVVVNYSTPKSPASVITKELYRYGDTVLTDNVMGRDISYDVTSFFQVNVPVFAAVLSTIKSAVTQEVVVDMYSGVGTIGLYVGDDAVLVELDAGNIAMAERNRGPGNMVVHASSESALEYVIPGSTLIVDPPRAGLHAKLIDHVLQTKPKQIIYLSCNPSTQARDLALLQQKYTVDSVTGYNFFPKTPHIESLAILNIQ